jgi:hypothetical protein
MKNKVETYIFGESEKWFYLECLEYDILEKKIVITVYPSDQENNKKHVTFSHIKNLKKHFENNTDENIFPKSILGIDEKDNIYTISCTDGEYIFQSDSVILLS